MQELEKCDEEGFGSEYSNLARDRLNALSDVREMLKHRDFRQQDLYLISLAIYLIFLDGCIQSDCIATISRGDVQALDKKVLDDYIAQQEILMLAYEELQAREEVSKDCPGKYPSDEVDLIMKAGQYLFTSAFRKTNRSKKADPMLSDDAQYFHEIAECMKSINDLFDLISREAVSTDFLRCLKTSYERLRKYSEIVKFSDINVECIERIAEINQKLENADLTEKNDGTAENGFKALLGMTLPADGEYDVFISYKHEDSDIASNVYHFLKSNLLSPFFDKVTLPELSNSQYEEAIMEALDHANNFIVVISDLEYLKSFWVKHEMDTFHHEIVEGRKKDANFLMIVTDDVYEKIMETNKRCLGIKYRSYEIIKVRDYKKVVLGYIKRDD